MENTCEALWPAATPCWPGGSCAANGTGCLCATGYERRAEVDANREDDDLRPWAPCALNRTAHDALYGATWVVASLAAFALVAVAAHKRRRGAAVLSVPFLLGLVSNALVQVVCSTRLFRPAASFFEDPTLMLSLATLSYFATVGLALHVAWALQFLVKTAAFQTGTDERVLRWTLQGLVPFILVSQAIAALLLISTLLTPPRVKRSLLCAFAALDSLLCKLIAQLRRLAPRDANRATALLAGPSSCRRLNRSRHLCPRRF
jgi:hypothetical protein